MDYKEFYDQLERSGLISANWKNEVRLLASLLPEGDETDSILKLLTLYFGLLDDGNTFMWLDEQKLSDQFSKKIQGLTIQTAENESGSPASFDALWDEMQKVFPVVCKIENLPIVSLDGQSQLFAVRDGKLFTRKNFNAVLRIENSVARLFSSPVSYSAGFDYTKAIRTGFTLSAGQQSIIEKGRGANLLITGGPGTGKTTSVFFLLLALLTFSPNQNIYLTAPSGKAASRMKESILGSSALLGPTFEEENSALIATIKNLEEYTIHRLLSYSPKDNCFCHDLENQFGENSIFVIDEASMIDVSIFASLLDAIPTGARVFILGDKNQLPSVECGAVFGSLLSWPSLQGNIVMLDESKRFRADSEIFRLSETINAGEDLSYIRSLWEPWETFTLAQNAAGITPIYYYLDQAKNSGEMVAQISSQWAKHFYMDTGLQDLCTNLEVTPDSSPFTDIWSLCERARILCANNEGSRGVQHINKSIIKEFYAGKSSISGYYPGELMMITRNNKLLDLYNGDCGVTVQFQGDDTLYLMLKKSSNLHLDEEKAENKIFKLGAFVFYPLRLISSNEMVPAFAITIHKSQGSDYENILVVLPKMKGHPLLNRQIVYTAITRTKKNTYILSNQENLEGARDTVLTRDTF